METMVEGQPRRTARPQVATQRSCRPWTHALVTGGSGPIREAFARALAVDGTTLTPAARRYEPLGWRARFGDD
jgi:NADP-dependent 3-hydroxy acid dehydrogenase YdfG